MTDLWLRFPDNLLVSVRLNLPDKFSPEKKSISYTIRNVENRYRPMTTMIKNRTPVQVPAGTGKKSRATRKKPAAKGFFGLLPDWKIDTQALKDELRD